MNIKLKLPYNPVGKLAGDGDDMSDEEYVNQLLSQFNAGYNSFMNNAMDGMMDPGTGVMDLMPEQYQIKSVKDYNHVEYYTFSALLNDMDDQPLGLNDLMGFEKSGEMGAFFIHLTVQQDTDVDASEELALWLKDCRDIMTNPHVDENYKVGMLPSKDLIIEASEDGRIKYLLSGARVIDQDNVNNFAIIVNKVKSI